MAKLKHKEVGNRYYLPTSAMQKRQNHRFFRRKKRLFYDFWHLGLVL